MPRQAGTSIVNNFIAGLVTEATTLSFPENACTDTSNCVFDSTGEITRRLGFDTEGDYTTDSVTVSDGDVYSTFIWDSVAGDGNVSFLVVQSADIISFYDTSSTAELSGSKTDFEIDLTTDYLVTNSVEDAGQHLCNFAVGNGDLFVTNPVCEPFYVQYDTITMTFTDASINIEERDFLGLEDGLDDGARPTSTVTALAGSNPEHLYNLYNQGWDLTDALDQWDTARTDLPNDYDYVALYREDADDAFDNVQVTSQSPGNRLAPKGHFLLNAFNPDRNQALTDAGYSFTVSEPSNALINPTGLTTIGDMTNASNAFDGNVRDNVNATKSTTTTAYIGLDIGSGLDEVINKVVIFPSQFEFDGTGYVDDANDMNITVTLYGSNSAPASATDGTSIGSGTITVINFSVFELESTDTTNEYRYVWVNMVPASTANFTISEVQFYSFGLTYQRPSAVAFYTGRVFYGGVKENNLSSNIYFTQIIENEKQYGKCYSKNDPTSEDFADLLPDDGGVIKIPEMGTLRKLYSYQSSLLAFANNGVWLISGTSGGSFRATDFVIKRISSIGVESADSVTSIRGLPAWWGEDGIYTVEFDANYDSFAPKSLTAQSIDTFYNNIPSSNKKYAKGSYDTLAQVAYWIYSDDVDLGTDKYVYNNVLCLDAKTNAFYTWTISSGPIVRTIDFIRPATRNTDGKVKFMIHQNYTGSAADQTFAEILNENYLDWEIEGTSINYDSYFVTGYKLDGETQKFFQPNYLFVFLKQITNSSCYVQAIFDDTTSNATGKWSSQQQIYNENLLLRGTNFRRLKLRGKGRILQLRFESEDQKPFNIIGWSIWETTNANL